MRVRSYAWSAGAVAAALLAVVAWPSGAGAAGAAQIETSGIVFSPSVIEVGQEANLCAINFYKRSFQAQLAILDASNTSNTFAAETVTLSPGSQSCINYTPTGISAFAVPMTAQVVISPPDPCRSLNSGLPPDPCKIRGSVEIDDAATHANRLHLEGVLLPAVQAPPQ